LGIKHPTAEVIDSYHVKLNVGIIANQQMKSSLAIETGKPKKNPKHATEIKEIAEFLSGYVAYNWSSAIRPNKRIQTFRGETIPHTETVNYKLTTALGKMDGYVRKNIDKLVYTSWPYELEDDVEEGFEEGEELSSDM
jgi:hypothetical protein